MDQTRATRSQPSTAWLALLMAGLFFALCPAHADTQADRLIEAARQQIGVTVRYDGAYRRLAYPMGDIPLERGVCTDVLVRAWRHLGIDLQQRVHEDMQAHWSAYPKSWGLTAPDSNIDHRRVPNLAVFFRRHGQALSVSQTRSDDYLPGDIVTWRLPGNLPHIGIVSSQLQNGRPLVIHNVGAGTSEEDRLFAYPITGHYRYSAVVTPSVVP